MPESRHLAVIMFTDIVGYTDIMQHNESEALIKINKFREVVEKLVKKFQGTLIQYYGDGALITFINSNNSLDCAIALQQEMRKNPKIPLRAGIHLGDILKKDGNIFGNSVNIASRIESMGVAGSILISEPVQLQIKNKLQYKLAPLGFFSFKNVDLPLEVFAVTNDHLSVPDKDEIDGKFKKESVRSIAVLPFVNMSNDPDQEYFSDGMAEEIINSITHLKNLNVAGRTSSFQFKGKNIDLRQIGKKLNVTAILEGSVRKQGNSLRITAQLVNVQNGYHIWSEQYDRTLNDVFEIQEEIALAISEKLLITLLKKDKDTIKKLNTINTEAYEYYLKGRFHCNRRGASLSKGLLFFQKAIEIEPGFALAHSGLAEIYMLLSTYSLMHPGKGMKSAKESAQRAIELDCSIPEPYCCLGYYYTCYEWNWIKARQNFKKSIELNPRYAEGQLRYGWTYLACVEGKFDEAENYGNLALHLEPLSAICLANHALILHCSGKPAEALICCNNGIEIDPNSFICHLNAGTAYHALRQYKDAIASFETAMRLSNRHTFAVNALIWTYCMSDNISDAEILYTELSNRSATEYIGCAITAISLAYMGRIDESIKNLEQAMKDKDPMLILLRYETWVPSVLKKDKRFINILNVIGFPKKTEIKPVKKLITGN